MIDKIQQLCLKFPRPVQLVRSARSRGLSISIKPFKPIRVSFPNRVPLNKLYEFLVSHTDWVNKNIQKVKQAESSNRPPASLEGIDINKSADMLFERLKFLAATHGFKYNRVGIRNQQTKWGSCSISGNISLNIQLARLQPHLIDYVIMHELVHTKVPNHSPKFWQELDKYIPNSKMLAKQVRRTKP